MVALVTIMAVAIGAALVFFIFSVTVTNARTTARVRKAERAVGIAIQGIRDLQRFALPASDDQHALSQLLKEMETALDETKDN